MSNIHAHSAIGKENGNGNGIGIGSSVDTDYHGNEDDNDNVNDKDIDGNKISIDDCKSIIDEKNVVIQSIKDENENDNIDYNCDVDDRDEEAKAKYLEHLEFIFSGDFRHCMSDSMLFRLVSKRVENAVANDVLQLESSLLNEIDKKLFGKDCFNVISMTFCQINGRNTCTFYSGPDNCERSVWENTHFVNNGEFVQVCVEKDVKDEKYYVHFCKQQSDGKIHTFGETKTELDFENVDYSFGFSSARCSCKSDLAPQFGKDIGFKWDAFLE